MARRKLPQAASAQPKLIPVRKPFASFAVLCEEAKAFEDGSVSITKIINKWMLGGTALPVAISFWVAVGLIGLPVREGRTVLLRFIRESDAIEIIRHEALIDTSSPDIQILVPVPNFPVVSYGRYRFSVVFDNRELADIPFLIEPLPSGGASTDEDPGSS
jgi:hypothetical protein